MPTLTINNLTPSTIVIGDGENSPIITVAGSGSSTTFIGGAALTYLLDELVRLDDAGKITYSQTPHADDVAASPGDSNNESEHDETSGAKKILAVDATGSAITSTAANAIKTLPVDAGGTAVTNSTAHAVKILPVDGSGNTDVGWVQLYDSGSTQLYNVYLSIVDCRRFAEVWVFATITAYDSSGGKTLNSPLWIKIYGPDGSTEMGSMQLATGITSLTPPFNSRMFTFIPGSYGLANLGYIINNSWYYNSVCPPYIQPYFGVVGTTTSITGRVQVYGRR